MGWNSANEIFDPVARKMTELQIDDEIKTEVLAVLIHEMQMGDWDTEGESLDEFAADPAIVEAFRRNKVILACGAESPGGRFCEEEKGHLGREGQPDLHKDWHGDTWPGPSREA